MFIRNLAAPVHAFTGFAILATGAIAAPAQTQGQLQLRSGPGATYSVLGSLGDGVHVEVLYCGNDVKWCLIGKNGKQGWVLPEQLASVGSAYDDRPVGPRATAQVESLSSKGSDSAGPSGKNNPKPVPKPILQAKF